MQCIYVRLEVQLVEIACYTESHTFNYFLTTPPLFFFFFCNKLKINDVLHRETSLPSTSSGYCWLYLKGNHS